jgi:hypothetical protein
VVILGYPGDPVVDDKNLPVRPSFTKNGSFMVFRKLEQNVLVLEDYVAKYWKTIPRDVAGDNSILLTDNERKQLFAARLVGRFKSVSYAVAKSLVLINADHYHRVCHSPSLLIQKIGTS